MKIHNLEFKNYNLYLLLIYSFWIISLLLYFFLSDYVKAGALINGVKFGADSAYYLEQTNNIIKGDYIFDNKSKIGYLLFLFPFLYFNVPLFFIVFFQTLLTAIAAFSLYKITEKIFCKLSGVICIGLFLLYFPIQIRNFYILTEMLFIDIVIILSYFFVYFKKKYLPLIIFLIIALISIRPNGILFLFGILISIFFILIKYKKYSYLSVYLIFLFFSIFPIIEILNSNIKDWNIIYHISNKGIIYGWSFVENGRCRTACRGGEFINNNYQKDLFGVIHFYYSNFFELFKIFLLKVFWLLLRARPYYSELHNFYTLSFSILIYSGFIYGFIKRPKGNFSVNVILFFILLCICSVGLTFVDWSGRFSLYFLPLVMIFSSYGLLIFTKKIFKLYYNLN